MPEDLIQTLARYAPSEQATAAEWDTARSSDTLAGIVGPRAANADASGRPPVHEIPLRFLPTSRPRHVRRRVLPLTAAVAVLACIAGIAVAVLHGDGGSEPSAGTMGAPFDPPAGLSNATAVGPHQYSYRVVQQMDLDAHGRPIPHSQNAMIIRTYLSREGRVLDIRRGSQNSCGEIKPQQQDGAGSLDEPTAAQLASLPTDIGKLTGYLRSHVQGSSSRDEAVFVAVGDMLRINDGLASPRLRGALLAVLSRTPGVIVHEGQRDYLNRPAIRADFVNQKIRPGEVQSLYFDPTTFQLLEDRDGSNGQPHRYSGPSPAYDAPAGPGVSPEQLTGAAYVDVMTESVVDKLPKLPASCQRG